MHRDIVCGLDICASNVRTLIARSERVSTGKIKDRGIGLLSAKENVLGFAESPTKGFSKSVVSNLGSLSDSIEASILKAEDMAKARVRKVITNVSGVHIRTFQSRGSVHISDRPSEIRREDIKRCIESAKLIAMSLDREAIHLVPVRFFIDDKMEINDPLGLFGSKLDVDLNIITSLVTVLQNITKAVNLAGYEVDDMVVSGAGTGLAIFSKEEMDNGAVLIDAGKEITELSLFLDGRLLDCFNFPFGGDDLTQILQDSLKIMFDEAEDLKVKYGVVTKDISRIDDSEIRYKGGVITRSRISNLLLPKVEAVMEEIHKRLEPFLKNRKNLPVIRVAGNAARMDGFIETIEDIFKVPVNMGRIEDTDRLKDMNFAASLGLMRYGMKKLIAAKNLNIQEPAGLAKGIVAKIKSIVSEYF